MAKPEQFFFPLMIAGAIAGLWVLVSPKGAKYLTTQRSTQEPIIAPTNEIVPHGPEPGTDSLYTYNLTPLPFVTLPQITPPPSDCGCDPCGTACASKVTTTAGRGVCLQAPLIGTYAPLELPSN